MDGGTNKMAFSARTVEHEQHVFNAAGRSPYVMDIKTHKMEVALTEHHDEHHHSLARLDR